MTDKLLDYTDGFLVKTHFLQLKHTTYESMYEMGEILYKIFKDFKEKPEYAQNKYEFESFNQLLAAPEYSGGLDFSRQTGYQMVRVYKTYVIDLDCKTALQSSDYSKLDIIKDVVTRDSLSDWLGKAKVLSRGDLRIEVKEALGKEMKNIEETIKCTCPQCGYKFT